MSAPSPTSRPNRPSREGGLVVLLLLLVAALIGSLVWVALLRGDLSSTRDDLALARSEVEQLRARANATYYQLQPAGEGPANASGAAFIALDGTGVITVANLDQPPDGRAYQVWYYPEPELTPVPGATFPVDETGLGFMLIPIDAGVFTQVVVTLEPETGSTSPTGPLVLIGTTGGARG